MTERVCVLLPAYNEAENLGIVISEALGVLDAAGFDASVLVVDDGSTDGTAKVIAGLAADDPRIRGLRLRRNQGKSHALRVGLRDVDGDVIILMDADGQDDATALPDMVAALDDGLDLVTGRRADRQDRFIKRHTSRVYNRTTSLLSGVSGRDFNSGLKVMRRDVGDALELYGELHRYIPVLAHWAGFNVGEIDVVHRPRMHGESKFGGNRFWQGFIDLITVNFLLRYNSRPLHLFGAVGGILGLIGSGLLAWMLVLKLTGEAIGDRLVPLIGIFLVIVSVQIISIGLIAELFVHGRYVRAESGGVDPIPEP